MNQLNIYKIAAVFIVSASLLLSGAVFAKTHTETLEGIIEGGAMPTQREKMPAG